MNEQATEIIEYLKRPPFEHKYSQISFDNLEGSSLLQLVSDVLSKIENKSSKVKVLEEGLDTTIQRISQALNIFKYPFDVGPEAFQNDLRNGKKQLIYCVTLWLLRNSESLSMRAYLAKYLIKIHIPPEFLQNTQLAELYEQYRDLIEKFKEIHKNHEEIKNNNKSGSEIKIKIDSLQKEQEQLSLRVTQTKKKLKKMDDVDRLERPCKELHQQRTKKVKLLSEKSQAKNEIAMNESKIHRLKIDMERSQVANEDLTPSSLLNKLQDDVAFKKYLISEKFPRELENLAREVENLSFISKERAVSPAEVENMRLKIKEMRNEIVKLGEEMLIQRENKEDKLAGFKNQAKNITRKKEQQAETFVKLRNQQERLLLEIQTKRELLYSTHNGEILNKISRKDEEINSVVAEYNSKRERLMKAEKDLSTLTGKMEELKKISKNGKQKLKEVEIEIGIPNYFSLQEEGLSTQRHHQGYLSLEELWEDNTSLNQDLNRRKEALSQKIRHIRQLRSDHSALKEDFEAKSLAYADREAELGSSIEGIRQEYVRLKTQEEKLETENNKKLEEVGQLEELAEDMDDPNRLQQLMERMENDLRRAEGENKRLKEQHAHMQDVKVDPHQQMTLLNGLFRMMQCKMELAKEWRDS